MNMFHSISFLILCILALHSNQCLSLSTRTSSVSGSLQSNGTTGLYDLRIKIQRRNYTYYLEIFCVIYLLLLQCFPILYWQEINPSVTGKPDVNLMAKIDQREAEIANLRQFQMDTQVQHNILNNQGISCSRIVIKYFS